MRLQSWDLFAVMKCQWDFSIYYMVEGIVIYDIKYAVAIDTDEVSIRATVRY